MTITYINRKKAGLCVECGQPSDGKVRCASCARRFSVRRYERQQERIRNGQCAWCGKPAKERLCDSCRQIERRYAEEYKRRRNELC